MAVSTSPTSQAQPTLWIGLARQETAADPLTGAIFGFESEQWEKQVECDGAKGESFAAAISAFPNNWKGEGIIIASPDAGGEFRFAGRVVAFDSDCNVRAIIATGTRECAYVGSSIAPLADVDGDGIDELRVYSWQGCDPSHSLGTFQIVSQSGEVIWECNGQESGSRFGAAVTNVGDTDGNGAAELLIAAPGAMGSDALPRAGQLLMYEYKGKSPLQVVRGDCRNGGLGTVILLLDDIDGDGARDIIVSEPGHRLVGTEKAGRVMALSGRTRRVMWDVFGRLDIELGTSLCQIGDLNADGVSELVAGAPMAASGRGEGWVISGRDGFVIGKLTPAAGTAGLFGYCLASVGVSTKSRDAVLAVSAPFERVTGSERGRVYVFRLEID